MVQSVSPVAGKPHCCEAETCHWVKQQRCFGSDGWYRGACKVALPGGKHSLRMTSILQCISKPFHRVKQSFSDFKNQSARVLRACRAIGDNICSWFALVLDKLRSQLNERGAKTIRGLGRVFRGLDSYDGNKKVDKSEFFVGLNEIGCELSQKEADVSPNSKRVNFFEISRFQLHFIVPFESPWHRWRRLHQLRRVPRWRQSKLHD